MQHNPTELEKLKKHQWGSFMVLLFIAAEIKYSTAHSESLHIQNFAFHPPSAAAKLNTMAMMNSHCIIVRCRSLFLGKTPGPNASFIIINIHIQEGLVSSLFPWKPQQIDIWFSINHREGTFLGANSPIMFAEIPKIAHNYLNFKNNDFVSLTWNINKIFNIFCCILRM